MSTKRTNGGMWIAITLIIITFLMYIVIAGLPLPKGLFKGGDVLLSAKQAIKYGLDLKGGVSITYMPEENVIPTADQIKTVINIMRTRLDAKGYTDANITSSQANRVIVEIPNLKDPQQAVKELGQTALLELIDPGEEKAIVGQPLTGGAVVLSGNEVISATAVLNPNTNKWEIDFEITPAAQKKFADATERLAQKSDGVIAITLDRVVISAPGVDEKIDSSKAQITGNFTQEEAKNLALLIQSGALPFKLQPVSTQYVGASLGQNALDISIKAGIIGFILVVLFMILMYRLPGLAASISLVGYIAAVLLILARTSITTLTLPGIAGVILSIGVAVDANVIIFERIKEELRGGKSLRAAIDAGYTRAWPAIRDANFTTIISSVVLAFFGTGPIKGFAYVLIIGVIVSMLSAILLTRFLMNQFYNLGFVNTKLYGIKEEKA